MKIKIKGEEDKEHEGRRRRAPGEVGAREGVEEGKEKEEEKEDKEQKEYWQGGRLVAFKWYLLCATCPTRQET